MSLVSSSNLILSSFSCLIAHSEKITSIDQFDLGNFLTKCIALVDETATTSLVSKAFRDYTLQAYPLIAKAYRKNQNDRPKLENIWLCFFVDKFFIKHRVNQDSLPESYRLVVNDIRKFVTRGDQLKTNPILRWEIGNPDRVNLREVVKKIISVEFYFFCSLSLSPEEMDAQSKKEECVTGRIDWVKRADAIRQWIPLNWESFLNIKQLHLRDLFYTIKFLPKEIAFWRNLRYLSIQRLGLVSLCPHIGLLSKLEELRVSENQLESIPEEINQLEKLKKLDLSYNPIRVNVIALPRLEQLRLSLNQLTNLSFSHFTGVKCLCIQTNSNSFETPTRLSPYELSVDQRKSLPAHFKTQYEDIWKFRYLDIRYDANYDQLIQGKVTYAGNGQSICTQFENIIVYKIVTPLVTPYIGSDKSRSIDQRLKNYPDLRKYFEGILDSFENKDKGT